MESYIWNRIEGSHIGQPTLLQMQEDVKMSEVLICL